MMNYDPRLAISRSHRKELRASSILVYPKFQCIDSHQIFPRDNYYTFNTRPKRNLLILPLSQNARQ